MARNIKSRITTKEYEEGWNRIFGKNKESQVEKAPETEGSTPDEVSADTEVYHSGE